MTTGIFGSSIKRREDPRLITGNGTYVDDIRIVGMLHLHRHQPENFLFQENLVTILFLESLLHHKFYNLFL